jgi:hypothetical protein
MAGPFEPSVGRPPFESLQNRAKNEKSIARPSSRRDARLSRQGRHEPLVTKSRGGGSGARESWCRTPASGRSAGPRRPRPEPFALARSAGRAARGVDAPPGSSRGEAEEVVVTVPAPASDRSLVLSGQLRAEPATFSRLFLFPPPPGVARCSSDEDLGSPGGNGRREYERRRGSEVSFTRRRSAACRRPGRRARRSARPSRWR